MTDVVATAENNIELERVQKECNDMIETLKSLEHQETELAAQCTILAREALLCGFDPDVMEPPAPKRRKPAVKKA